MDNSKADGELFNSSSVFILVKQHKMVFCLNKWILPYVVNRASDC